MSKFTKTFGRRYNDYMTKVGRAQARRVLLGQSDQRLDDMGISRAKLESGVHAWPWRLIDEQPHPSTVEAPGIQKRSRLSESRAIRELKQCSDRELHDLGITRGTIVEAVRNGRTGVELKRNKPAAA